MGECSAEFYRVSEVAKRLGVSRSRVYQLIAAGEVPAVRVGNALRVPVATWEKWVRGKAAEAVKSVGAGGGSSASASARTSNDRYR